MNLFILEKLHDVLKTIKFIVKLYEINNEIISFIFTALPAIKERMRDNIENEYLLNFRSLLLFDYISKTFLRFELQNN